jgi:hypothetical protein
MQDDTKNSGNVPVGNDPDFTIHSYIGEEYLRFILARVSTSAIIGPAQVEYSLYTIDPVTQDIRYLEDYKPDGIPNGIPDANNK